SGASEEIRTRTNLPQLVNITLPPRISSKKCLTQPFFSVGWSATAWQSLVAGAQAWENCRSLTIHSSLSLGENYSDESGAGKRQVGREAARGRGARGRRHPAA